MENELRYNPDSINKAITETNSLLECVNNFANFSNISIPSGFSSASAAKVQGIASKCSSLFTTRVQETSSFLNMVKKEMDSNIEVRTLSSEPIGNGTLNVVELNGQVGYLYIPKGGAVGKPLVTYLGGLGEASAYNIEPKTVINEYYNGGSRVISNLAKNGLPNLLNNGYTMDAVVFAPLFRYGGAWQGRENMDATINNVEYLLDEYNLDTSRNIIIGYSSGGYGAFECVSENPNLFSTCVTYGAYPNSSKKSVTNEELETKLANSGTNIVIYAGTSDNDFSCHKNAIKAYENINNQGGKVSMIDIKNAHHGDVDLIFSEDLIDGVLGARRGESFNGEGQFIEIDKKTAETSSIRYKGQSV